MKALTVLFAAAQGTQPAGGAALGQVAIATAGATLLTIALMWLGMGHRSGKVSLLSRASDLGRRLTGLPGWTAFPGGVATVSLLLAVFGMYWDISLHIGVGRDTGPLANPAHYFILAGLFGIFSAGFFAMVLPTERPSSTAIRIGRDWDAPLGGVLICAAGAFALTGFPLDDIWHRLFGQDVTLWGPTHLMLIGGAAMTLIGIAVLLVEGARSPEADRRIAGPGAGLPLLLTVPLCGGLLIALSTFQAEFDFGVPQFRFVFQPILIMVAAGVGLTAARLFAGRGTALGAVAFFLLVRGLLSVLIGPVLGETTPHMPLYVVEALVVEGVALRISRDRPLAFGLACGVGIGTIGLAAEWAWSQVWMPLPWPAQLFPEGALLGFAAAVAGGLLGAWIGHRLDIREAPGLPSLRKGALVGATALAAIVAFALYKPAETGVSAHVTLTQVQGGPDRTVNATVRLRPPDAAAHAEWLTMTAWQGGGLKVDRLEHIGPGTYRTTEPVPVHGGWKSLVRLHDGDSLTALPIFLPEDKAIPAKGVPARPEFTRPFVADHEILQREQKTSAPGLTVLAYAVVVGIALSLLMLLAWGLHRLGSGGGGQPGRAPSTGRYSSDSRSQPSPLSAAAS